MSETLRKKLTVKVIVKLIKRRRPSFKNQKENSGAK
jgi:hypothetical protein